VEEVRVAFESFEANRSNLARVRDELMPLQQQRRQQAEDAYRAGLADVTALYLAEQDLRSAQTKLIEIEQQLSIALVRLERAAGGSGVAVSIGSGTTHPGALAASSLTATHEGPSTTTEAGRKQP
jgi:outer membrane protein TolC